MDSIDEGELVLTLTENATTVIKSITGADATPSEAGVRISQQDPSTAQLALNTAEAPMPGDAVVEEQARGCSSTAVRPTRWTTRCWTPRSTRRARWSSP